LLGPEAAGLSASTITRLLRVWQDEYQSWQQRSLQGKDYVYLWADGVYFNVRLGEDRLACLVVLGVLPDGRKEVVALAEGYRESTESWATLLRDVQRRGLPAPVLATADGALGFWAALHEVYPGTRGQRCWVHKIANVLDKLPKRLHSRAKGLLHQIMGAPDRASAQRQIALFRQEFASRYPKAADCLSADEETLLTFFDFPAEHWLHLRTTNPIESPFASVKVRTRKTKGAGSRSAGVALAFRLLLNAEQHWHKVTAPHLIALVRAGVLFQDGAQVSAPVTGQSQDTPHVETERIAA